MQSLQTQKALVVKEPKGVPVLDTIPIPMPGAGEMLIKVKSVALNPIDWKAPLHGNLFIPSYPTTLGLDIAGEVEEVGEGVVEFGKGDRVFGLSEAVIPRRGGTQEYTIFTEDAALKIPPNISYDEASTIPLTLLTAYSGLYSAHPHGLGLTPPTTPSGKGKYATEAIVLVGGSSSVGQAAIQLARLSGFALIITTASLEHAEPLKKLGATHVLDRTLSPEDLQAEISKITSSPHLSTSIQVNYSIDCILSVPTQRLALDVLTPNGHAAYAGPILERPRENDEERNKTVAQIHASFRNAWNEALFKELYATKLYEWIEQGHIVPNRVEVLPNGLDGIVDGLKRLQANAVSRIKLVAHPEETA